MGLHKVANQLKARLTNAHKTESRHLTEIKRLLENFNEDVAIDEGSLPSTLRKTLGLCQNLNAAREGIGILKFMAKKVPFTYAEFIFSEGVIQRGFNDIIVEFVCSVSGLLDFYLP